MIYLICGDDIRKIEYKRIKEKLEKNATVKIFDGAIEEEVKDFNEISSMNNLFSNSDLLILKRGEKVKKIDDLISNLLKTLLINKEIIIDIEDKEGRLQKKFKNLQNLEIIFITDDKKNSKKIEYIEKRLNIKKNEAFEVYELIKGSFDKIEKEVDKIEVLLISKKYSIEEIKKIILENGDENLLEACELLIDRKLEALERIVKNIEFLPFLYTLITFLKLCFKLKMLPDIKKVDNYTFFYNEIYPKIKDKLKEHPYFIFKNINRSLSMSEEFIEKKFFDLLLIEYRNKIGELNDKEAINFIILGFFK